jgi:hypothetical protein
MPSLSVLLVKTKEEADHLLLDIVNGDVGTVIFKLSQAGTVILYFQPPQ